MADDTEGLSSRDFLKTTGIATGALVGGGLIGGLSVTTSIRKVKLQERLTRKEQEVNRQL